SISSSSSASTSGVTPSSMSSGAETVTAVSPVKAMVDAGRWWRTVVDRWDECLEKNCPRDGMRASVHACGGSGAGQENALHPSADCGIGTGAWPHRAGEEL